MIWDDFVCLPRKELQSIEAENRQLKKTLESIKTFNCPSANGAPCSVVRQLALQALETQEN